MTDPIEPIQAANRDRRQRARRTSDPSPQAASTHAQVPAVATPDPQPDPQPVVAAQLLGQDGQKRGLRGGPEVLAKAKAAYLSAEWSGPLDRRGRTGVMSKREV